LQAKLLRVLQEKSFERVGSGKTLHVDVRVLATTNRDLRMEVVAGRFREDLYYRLAVVPLGVPPLRQRREDIPELIDYFLDRMARRLGRQPCSVQPDALDLMVNYPWPGNVRELENIITRSSVLNTGTPITADELSRWLIGGPETPPKTAPAGVPVGLSLQEMERKLIEATLDHFSGHRAKTAEALGIGLRTLTGKLREYGYAPREKSYRKAG
jgi:DNA-binding NtrC family response regulator